MMSPRCPAIGARRPASPAALASEARADRRRARRASSMSKRTIETIARRSPSACVCRRRPRRSRRPRPRAAAHADCARLRRRSPTLRATAGPGNLRPPPTGSAPNSTAPSPTPSRSAATIASSCSSARSARPMRRNQRPGRPHARQSRRAAAARRRRPADAADLIARFNSECAGALAARPILLDALFGGAQIAASRRRTLSLNPDQPQEKEGEARGRRQGGLRAYLRRQFLPGLLLRERRADVGARGHVPVAVPERRRLRLYDADQRRHHQALSAGGQPYTSSPTALKYRQSYRFVLLLPAKGRELGRSARRRRRRNTGTNRAATSSSRRRNRRRCRAR